MEIAEEIGVSKEDITYALDAIQSPVSLYEPIYTDGGDPLYVMDQISDKKNLEEISFINSPEILDFPKIFVIIKNTNEQGGENPWIFRSAPCFFWKRTPPSRRTPNR